MSREGAPADATTVDGEATARVAVRGPLDAAWIESFLAARAIARLERFEAGEYVRTLAGRRATIGVRFARGRAAGRGGTVALRARSERPLAAGALTEIATRLFDLDAPLERLHRLAERDPVLAPLVAQRPGLRLLVYDDPFEALIRAILGQQVSVAAARTLGSRLVERFGEPAPPLDGVSSEGAPDRFFPEPEALAAAGPDKLRTIGLTGAKAATLHAAAEAVASGALDLHALRAAPADQATAALRALPGIGPWTAAYVRLRGLGDRDAFPAGDLGVRKAFADPDGRLPNEKETARRAAAWSPWRGYATLHLWAGLG